MNGRLENLVVGKLAITGSERSAYNEAVLIPHQNSLGSTEDTDDIWNAIRKAPENLEELRGPDHKAIRNQKLGRGDRES
jgi:hypothetical protein